jgi:hypothetical protein
MDALFLSEISRFLIKYIVINMCAVFLAICPGRNKDYGKMCPYFFRAIHDRKTRECWGKKQLVHNLPAENKSRNDFHAQFKRMLGGTVEMFRRQIRAVPMDLVVLALIC